MKWRYGNAWEQFPIKEGQVWGLDNGSRVAVHNIFEPLPKFAFEADMLFIDPPWNLGNLNCFYTKAGRDDYLDTFDNFEKVLFQRIREIGAPTCYIEIGKQAVDGWERMLSELYPVIQRWDVTYYHKNLCHILRGGQRLVEADFTGWDEEEVIYQVCKSEQYQVVGDLCMGLGLVGRAAFEAGKPFIGTELNKRRLANLLQKLDKKGAKVKRYE